MKPTAATAPSETLARFAALLRDHGLSVGIAEQKAMLQAALVLGPLHERRLCAAWRAIACHNAREWRLWPELFARHWHAQRLRGGVRVSGQARSSRDLRQLIQQLHESASGSRPPSGQGAASAAHAASDASMVDSQNGEGGLAPHAMGGASRAEPPRSRGGQQLWLWQEQGALQALARRIKAGLRPVASRRWRKALPGHRLALRHTLRQSAAMGGESLLPIWQARREDPPRLFILADVSRSMESHAPLFLRIARAFATGARARVFVFHTQLAEVTPLLRRDSSVVQETVDRLTAGFGAGTRIAFSLREFARVHARGALRRGAHVWVWSDGFDTDEPGELGEALRMLRARGARITWFHPTRKMPVATALQRARGSVERFVPLASVADLAAARPMLR